MSFEIVNSSVLRVFKTPIKILGSLADHYYLAEKGSLDNSLGWGPDGIELRGRIKITLQELERVEKFILNTKYSIAINNCEHFANYVLHGINFSSQENNDWKNLGAKFICRLQPVQSVRENYNSFMLQQIKEVLNNNLKQAKIERANRERIEFWKSRGIEVK